MEKFVKGIREDYYDRIIKDYRKEGEQSFLYRAFWAESVKELVKKSLPPLPGKNELGKQMEELSRGFLEPLADEENEAEQMKEYFAQLPEEVKKLLEVHLPQLPEGVVKLLKEHSRQLPDEVKRFPWLLKKETAWPRYGVEIRRLVKENMLKRPEWAREVLKQKPPKRTEKKQGSEQEKDKKERRDFWEELMLNDAGYEAGLITDTEYYLWLTEYLAVRDIHYKDTSMNDGHVWLYKLLNAGLGRKLEDIVKLEEAQELEEKIERLEKEIGRIKELQERKVPRELKKLGENLAKHEEKLKKIKKLKELQGRDAFGKPEDLKKLEEDFKKLVDEELQKLGEKLQELRKRLQEVKEFYGFEKAGRPGEFTEFEEGCRNIRDKAGVGRDMAELAGKFRNEVETGDTEISNRLHGLKCKEKTGKGQIATKDYLLWLTKRLEKMAIHIKVKTRMQDYGYSIVDIDKTEKQDETKKLFQECRKQDFSLRLFGAYCDSDKGYDFVPKEEGGRISDESWIVKNGFCVWEPNGLGNHLQALLQALKQEGREDFYFPLAMDLHSGCVFFLAGKGYYAEVYEESKDTKLKTEYRNKDAFYCYDYLRLDKRKDFRDSEVAFRLQPTFHENAGKRYDEVLGKFEWYCGSGRSEEVAVQGTGGSKVYSYEDEGDIPRQKIKGFNEEKPDGIAETFQRFFEDSMDSQPRWEARDDFRRTQKRTAKDRLPDGRIRKKIAEDRKPMR